MNTGTIVWIACFIASLCLAPLLAGIINKVKAFFAGRRGPRLLQLYYDLAKLLRKDSVCSTTSGGLLMIAPCASLAALLGASLFLPYGMMASPFWIVGDSLLFFYLLGFSRMITVLGALDTGSSFEGMGGSREMQFSALAEAAIFGIIGFLMLLGQVTCMSGLARCSSASWSGHATSLLLALAAFFVVLLAENCRVPFDDPETHLELTMIHEAMILDYGGPDLALILYGASLKLWLFASFLVLIIFPWSGGAVWLNVVFYFAGVGLIAVIVGVVESCMARYRFLKVPQALVGALAVSLLAVFFLLVFEGGLK